MTTKAFKLSAMAATLFLVVSPTLAQDNASGGTDTGSATTALDNVPGPGEPISGTSADMMMTEGAYGVFFEDDGTTMRSEEDFMSAYEAASAEDQEMINTACADWEEERVGFLDSVSANCRAVLGPEEATDQQ